MRTVPRLGRLPTYRKPQELEDSWECTSSGRRFVFEPDPLDDEADAAPQTALKPRCPCHQRFMRRSPAPWRGFPAYVGKAVFAAITFIALWTLHAALCLIPVVGPLLAGC